MSGQQINRASSKFLILSYIVDCGTSRVHAAAPIRRRHSGTYLAAINCGSVADDLTFLRNGELEKPFAKLAAINTSCGSFASCVWSTVLP